MCACVSTRARTRIGDVVGLLVEPLLLLVKPPLLLVKDSHSQFHGHLSDRLDVATSASPRHGQSEGEQQEVNSHRVRGRPQSRPSC